MATILATSAATTFGVFVTKVLQDLGDANTAIQFMNSLIFQMKNGHFGDYAYSFFLALALVVASIGIVLIGREEAEEKTILPVKK